MTGLTAARCLTRPGHTVIVLDKGRGVGGRMATRRLETTDRSPARADHGAPYFSAQTPDFLALADELTDAGVVQRWPRPEQISLSGLNLVPTYTGEGGMNAVAKYLADGLLVQTSCRIVRVIAGQSGWGVTTDTGDQYEADALLLTLPVPQALTLLADSDFALDPADQAALETVHYQPCLAMLVALNQPSNLPTPGLVRFDDLSSPVSLVIDNQQKGCSPDRPTLTIYASATYSQTHFDDNLDSVGHDLLAHLADLIPPGSIETVQVHRWRYSTADRRLPESCRRLVAPFPLIIGGDAFGQGGVEGAFLSGKSMSDCSNE